jgi:glycosyltransferase involved in cell wall biosynthesis
MKVSILINTFNRSFLLNQRIKNIFSQDYENFELIIIDDASTDNTSEVIKSFKDNRITYIKKSKNIGSEQGDRPLILEGFYEISSGDLFIYTPDDDYWSMSNFLSVGVSKFKKFEKLQIFKTCQVTEFYENEELLRTFDTNEIKEILSNKNNNQYFNFQNLLPKTGYYTGRDYLKLFSKQPATFMISTNGCIFKRQELLKINYLKSQINSKWQAGIELYYPNFFIGDIFFLNEPNSIVRANQNNVSFNRTQTQHLEETIFSIENAFMIKTKNLDKNFLNKVKKDTIYYFCISYLKNSIRILQTGQLGLASKENMEGFVTLKFIFKIFFKHKILFKLNECKLILGYIFSYKMRKYPKLANFFLFLLRKINITN